MPDHPETDLTSPQAIQNFSINNKTMQANAPETQPEPPTATIPHSHSPTNSRSKILNQPPNPQAADKINQ